MKKKEAVKEKPTREAFELPLKIEPMVGMGGGFRSEWVSAEYKGVEFGIDSGAGLGNPLLTFWVKKKDKTEYWTASVSDVLRAFFDRVVPP